MAFLEDKDLWSTYTQAKSEADQWKKGYHEYERLAANDLAEDLDESLPETNDGSLAASLFKLPKRIISTKLVGQFKALDRDEAWITELANIVWTTKIIPNANTQAPFHRKWKDAVRKAAIYGAIPLITIFVDKGDGSYRGSDFIVGQPQDVALEPGKVSDYDSDIIYYDVYFTQLQLKNIKEQAKSEETQAKEDKRDSYNKWDTKVLDELIEKNDVEDRSGQDLNKTAENKAVTTGGIHLCMAVQRGVNAPFKLYSKDLKKTAREWSNPDPTGDVNIHYLYCYQDFINPYGIGICKLAGGTQNVLDYMRQADVLATQLGLRSPISLSGDLSNTDFDSIVWAQDAIWEIGNATHKREEPAGQVYQSLPDRISMYKTSLNQIIPTGDTSIPSGTGDPQYSKTPAGVKFQQAALSVDDQDFKDNVDMTYEAVAESIMNTHFANMNGSDILKLSDEDRDKLMKAGLDFPVDENGDPTNELNLIWENARATFKFTMDADSDIETETAKRLDGLMKVAELLASDPNAQTAIEQTGKKVDLGELYSEIIKLTSDSDKIIVDLDSQDETGQDDQQPPQDPSQQGAETAQPKTIAESIRWTPADLTPSERSQVLAQGGVQADPEGVTPAHIDQSIKAHDVVSKVDQAQQSLDQPQLPQGELPNESLESSQEASDPNEPNEEHIANMNAVMQEHGVDQHTAAIMLMAEEAGVPIENISSLMEEYQRQQNG